MVSSAEMVLLRRYGQCYVRNIAKLLILLNIFLLLQCYEVFREGMGKHLTKSRYASAPLLDIVKSLRTPSFFFIITI